MKAKCINCCAVECVNGDCQNIRHEEYIACMDCCYNKGCLVCAWYVNGECDISGEDCNND